MEKSQLYDNIVNATFINIYSKSKDGKIIFLNFDTNAESNLFLLRIASQVVNTINDTKRNIYINTSFIKYIIFKIKNRKIKVKRLRKGIITKESTPIIPEAMLSFMAKEFDVDIDIYSNIYNSYYKDEIQFSI